MYDMCFKNVIYAVFLSPRGFDSGGFPLLFVINLEPGVLSYLNFKA